MTVTNNGATKLNMARVNNQFRDEIAESKSRNGSVPADPTHCQQKLTFCEGMKVRLTKNMDKERSFVNGTLATIVKMLNKCTFIAVTSDNVRILVHAVADTGRLFVPAVYGYAMTIRRTQGCTLAMAGLHFDRRVADRGYGYVGASRVKHRNDIFLMGRVRRTDWLPVGEDPDGGEQLRPSI